MSESASATLSVVQLDATTFQYNVTLTNTGGTTIGGFWLAWLPGLDFLPTPALTEAVPAGWQAAPFPGNGVSNGSSVQFFASSSASYVQAGGTLTGFSFTSHDSPAVLEGNSAIHPPTPILTTVAYKAGIEAIGDPGFQFVVSCFAAGTRILTVSGEMPVEDLAVGDLLPTLRAGHLAPVRWLGHRSIDCGRHPRADEVLPVRVRAGAFGPGRPARDLLLSPDHSVLVDATLIPVRYLVNGATIARQAVDRVEYWHVELPAHGVLLAEGLEVESYLDTGARAGLSGGAPALPSLATSDAR